MNEKTKSILVFVFLAVGIIFVVVGTVLSFTGKSTNNNENQDNNKGQEDLTEIDNTSNEIAKKLITNDTTSCQNIIEEFNGVTVELSQQEVNSVCRFDKVIVNSQELQLSNYGESIVSFEYFDNNIIFVVDTLSTTKLIVYNLDSNNYLENFGGLEGVSILSYFSEDNKIYVDTIVYPYEQSTIALYDADNNVVNNMENEMPNLRYIVEYMDGSFGKPELTDGTYHW